MGQNFQRGSAGGQTPGVGAAVGGNNTCPASMSVAATMGTNTIATARVSEGGAGSKKPETAVTQQERADLLCGVGSQFESMAVPDISGNLASGLEHL